MPLEQDDGPANVFARVFRRLRLKRSAPEFRVEFRPFAGLRSTIQLRGDRAEIHIADVLAAAPPIVLEALAEILLARVFHRWPSREARECYLAYVFRPEVRRRIDEARRERGSKRMLPARGQFFDLKEIFDKLNRRFFHSRLAPPRLGWSSKRAHTVLGHYDAAHDAITISRRLDSRSVPRYLVEFLVFHEMLHLRFPVGRRGHRRVVHSREFRDAEKRFPMYEQAHRRLKSFCA